MEKIPGYERVYLVGIEQTAIGNQEDFRKKQERTEDILDGYAKVAARPDPSPQPLNPHTAHPPPSTVVDGLACALRRWAQPAMRPPSLPHPGQCRVNH